jgi:hypothetical protein
VELLDKLRLEKQKDIYKTKLKLEPKSGIRQYSSNSNMVGEKEIIRDIKKGYTNGSVEQSNVLKPILNINLLAPIVYTDSIIENIKDTEYILSRIPDNNVVKQILMSELENKIEIIADKAFNTDEVNKVVSEIDNFHVEEDIKYNEKGEMDYSTKSVSLNDITRNKFSYTNNPIFIFNPEYTFIKSKLCKNTASNSMKTLSYNSNTNIPGQHERLEFLDLFESDRKSNIVRSERKLVSNFSAPRDLLEENLKQRLNLTILS